MTEEHTHAYDALNKHVDTAEHEKSVDGVAKRSATVEIEIYVGKGKRLRPMEGEYAHGLSGLPPRAQTTKSLEQALRRRPLGSRAPVTMLRSPSRELKTCRLVLSPVKLININYAKRDESTGFPVYKFFVANNKPAASDASPR